jgi:hypothetical protein
MALRPLSQVSCIVCFVTLSVLVQAQEPTGTITGVVRDPSGAIVSGASVTIVDKSTHSTTRTLTSTAGVYSAPSLQPGPYELHVEAKGFKQTVVDLEAEVGRVTTADVRLQVGDVKETVTVEANAVRVNLAQTALEGIVTQELFRELPLNGRNFLDLGQLEPGVQVNTATGKGAYSMLGVAGQSGVTTRVTVDGLDISDEHFGTVAQNISTDSIQEYQISRSTSDVSTGLTGSGAVNIVTKSGANELHGSAFFFWRDDAFAARIGQEPAPFDREQGGFGLGGPFVRDRLFWFMSYERNNQDAAVATNIPGFPQFAGTWPFPYDEEMALGRLDANLTRALHAFVRFTHNSNAGIASGSLGGVRLSPLFDKNNANQTALGLDANLGRFTHSVRFGYQNYDNNSDTAGNLVPGLPQTLDPAGRPLAVSFGLSFLGTAGDALIGPAGNAPVRRFHDTHEIRYDGGFSFGRHAVRWGAVVNIIRINWFASISAHAPLVNLLSNSDTRTTCKSDLLCYPVASAMIGNGLGFWTEVPSHGLPYGGIKNDRVHWYVADSWRATPRLNVNFGLRWVFEPGPDNPDLKKPAVQNEFLPGRANPNRRDMNNFAPQLGMAWNPTGSEKWVVRAGAGVFFDTNLLKHVIFERNSNLPLGITQEANQLLRDPITNNVIFDLNGRNSTPPAQITPGVNWVGRPLGFPGIPGPPPGGTVGMSLIDALIAAQQAFQAAFQVAYDRFPFGPTRCELRRNCATFGSQYTTPYSFQFNAGVQREIRPGLVLSADYVRHRGLHLLLRINQNRVGGADNLSVANALAAMDAVHRARGCPLGPAGVECAIASPIAPSVTIATYAAQGLGNGSNATATRLSTFAFSGVNPSFNNMALFSMSGMSTYNALQVQLRGRLPNVGKLAKDHTVVASYSLSRLEAKGTYDDSELLNFSDHVFNDKPLAFHGPATIDRTHMLSLASLFTVPGGVRLDSIWRAFSALPQTLFVPQVSGGAAEIFQTDFNGDGLDTDPLPGTNRGGYGRSLGCGAGAVNRVIDAYNSTQAGKLTPAGHALVNAGLFSEAQLSRLGAVSPIVPRAPDGQVCLDSFITTDVRIARPFKPHGERVTIEPAFEWFNLFNVANYDLPANKLSGILTGAVGSLNGTTRANRPNRAGFGGGSFALGTPRSWQLALRVSF